MGVNDIYRVAAQGKYDTSEDYVNTFHFRVLSSDAPSGFDEAQAVADAFEQAWFVNSPTVLSRQVDNLIYNAIDVVNALDSSVGYTKAVSYQGTRSGAGDESLPPQVAVLVLLRSGRRGRRYNGRSYLGAISESYCVDGKINEANAISLALPYYDLFNIATDVSNPVQLNAQLVVYSPTYGITTEVVEAYAQRKFAVQRRRGYGVGS